MGGNLIPHRTHLYFAGLGLSARAGLCRNKYKRGGDSGSTPAWVPGPATRKIWNTIAKAGRGGKGCFRDAVTGRHACCSAGTQRDQSCSCHIPDTSFRAIVIGRGP